MIKITAELKAELTNKSVNDNISKFLNKIFEFKNQNYYNYKRKNNKLTIYIQQKKELLTDPEVNKKFEETKNSLIRAVKESKEIYKSEYNFTEEKLKKIETVNVYIGRYSNQDSKIEEFTISEFSAELYFNVKEFSNKDIINYLYHEAEKEAKEKLEYKLISKIEIDREKFLFKIINATINLPKAKIEKIIKENLKNNIFYVSFGENIEYYKDFTNFEAETEEYNKKAEEYNKNLIKNYIKETDPELYFAKFSKETVKETETVKKVKEEAVKAEEIKEEISEEYYFSLNFHELNKFIKAGSEFMKLSAELRFQLYNYRQFLYEKTYR